MKHLKSYAGLMVLSVLIAAAAVVPVNARPDVAEVGQASTETSERRGGERSEEAATVHAEKLREKGEKRVTEERKSKSEKTLEQRQKACEKRAENINRKLSNYTSHAEKHLGTFDKIYDRVQEFQETKKLDAANYDELIAAADAKQAAAVAAVEALAEVSTSIDCASEDPAAAVAAVKEAVAETRTALKEYRTAIKDVIKSLNASADKADDTSDESTDSGSTENSDTNAGDSTSTDSTDADGTTTSNDTETN